MSLEAKYDGLRVDYWGTSRRSPSPRCPSCWRGRAEGSPSRGWNRGWPWSVLASCESGTTGHCGRGWFYSPVPGGGPGPDPVSGYCFVRNTAGTQEMRYMCPKGTCSSYRIIAKTVWLNKHFELVPVCCRFFLLLGSCQVAVSEFSVSPVSTILHHSHPHYIYEVIMKYIWAEYEVVMK